MIYQISLLFAYKNKVIIRSKTKNIFSENGVPVKFVTELLDYEENKLWVASIADSPKFPPCRITLTFPVINNAHNVIFIALGGSKAKIIKEIFREDSSNPLPAARISPSHGQLYWLMDNAAASEINKTE
ncbi:6-phosphogluconolactonase-like [Centruroides sculpturatus]|uniref:6-phosphogluconolactonase-like n=1 Tax=Centruroides sculpturatus TaxID=218467 RepID=UPI000C6EFD59|nr:6-phosphogluconolactonase-like [Centruroides sculpturatus]